MSPHAESSSSSCPIRTVAVFGTGRVGTALSRALDAAEYIVVGPLSRSEEASDADVALLCVPDDAIPETAARARRTSRWVGHVSGAVGLDAVDFGLHPLFTFTGQEDPAVFSGMGIAIGGVDADARDRATELATSLGSSPFPIEDRDRDAYHAAAAMASNLLLTLEAAAERVATGAGLTEEQARALLAPLVRATVENWARTSPAEALTGPVARGDEGTISAHRTAIRRVAPELLPLYDELTLRTRDLSSRGRL